MMERLLVCFVAAKADRHASRPNRRIVSCSAASNQSTYNGIWLLVCLASAKADRHASFPNRRIVAYSAASNQNTEYGFLFVWLPQNQIATLAARIAESWLIPLLPTKTHVIMEWLLVCLASADADRHASRPNRRMAACSAASSTNIYIYMCVCV